MRREEFPLQNIKAKDRGQVEWAMGMYVVIVLGIMMYTQLQLAAWDATADYLEDALAASNLAAALIDVEEYGKSHRAFIGDASFVFDIYRDAVRENLQLNQSWECANQTLISGPVEITDFVIYNVDGDHVEATRLNVAGQVLEQWSGESGILKAPNGVSVEHTGIYSEIQFQVRGFLGICVDAHKGKLVDIVSEDLSRREQ